MNNQNNQTSYASNVNANPEQNSTESIQIPPCTEADSPYIYNPSYTAYPPMAYPEDGYSKTLGILSVIFSSVGLTCCGIQFSIIGLIVGIVAMVQAKKNMQKSSLGLTGVILGAASLVLYSLLLIGYFSLIISSLAKLGGSFDGAF